MPGRKHHSKPVHNKYTHLSNMTVPELKAKAHKMGVSTTNRDGTVADKQHLIRKITYHS